MNETLNQSSPPIERGVIAAILFLGAAVCVAILRTALEANGMFGFPLDDPWIHLQFARNLYEFGSFSYFKNEMVVAGSTSPLYTILLSAGFWFTSNEMVLSYLLGALFLLGAAYAFFLYLRRDNSHAILIAALATVLLLLEPRMQWGALSGMETTLFIMMSLFVLYAYKSKNGVLLGVSAGLLVWSRPEGVLFLIVIGADALYHSYRVAKPQTSKKKNIERPSLKWLRRPAIIFGIISAAYFIFNFYLSGSLLPNTYAAKSKYYSGGGADFPKQVFQFLTEGHLQIFAFFVGAGLLLFLSDILRKRPTRLLIPMLWSVGLFLAYWKTIPFLYQEGRYLMPILPFVMLIGFEGVKFVGEKIGKTKRVFGKWNMGEVLVAAGLLGFSVQFGMGSWKSASMYAGSCKYINDRQVKTAHWVEANLPKDAIIGTHDIGAIGYYSGRRIADMVGLVSPEMVENIGSYEKLKRFLIKEKVTHLVLLRNWFEVGNQNPLFTTDERTPEIMEVFEFDPNRTHFTSQQASRLTQAAANYLSVGNVQQAGQFLQQSLTIDPSLGKTHYFMGRTLFVAGKMDEAEREFETALRLHPDLWDAELAIAEKHIRTNAVPLAYDRLQSMILRNPNYEPAAKMLASLERSKFDEERVAKQSMSSNNKTVR